MKLTDQLLTVADAYCEAVSLSRSRVSFLLFNHGARLDRIAGGADVRARSFEAAMVWFAERWPAHVAWPEGVARPVVPAPAVAGGEAGSVVAASVPASAGGAA